MPLETPSDGLDLAAMRAASDAVEVAAARARAGVIRDRLEPALAAMPPPLRQALDPLLDRLIEEIGRADARAEAARQAATEARRSRGDWLRIDPLAHIPEDRATPPAPPPGRYEAWADSPDFAGFGWHAAEGKGPGSWRWSGLTAAASVIVPELGPGSVALELDLEVPWGLPFDPDAVTVLANGEPLELLARIDGSRATLAATWDGTGSAGASIGLVILAPVLGNPRSSDARKLGIGFRRVSAARV